MSRPLAAGLALAAATLPALAQARDVTLTTKMNDWRGEGAYLAIYVVDAQGAFQGTLWMAAPKAKYWRHLSDWMEGSGGDAPDGVTGASVGQGRTLAVTVDLADALFDAGYEIRIDSSVEKRNDYPSDVVAPLTKAGAGKEIKGSGYVASLRYDF